MKLRKMQMAGLVAGLLAGVVVAHICTADGIHTEPDPADPATAAKFPWSTNIDGFTLTIKPENEFVKPCRPIYIDAVITNTANADRSFNIDSWDQGWYFIITDSLGKPVKNTTLGQYLVSPGAPDVGKFDGPQIIKSGESLHYRILLNSMYDLSVMQKYSVTAKSLIYYPGSFPNDVKALKSNSVNITVQDWNFGFVTPVRARPGNDMATFVFK